MKDLLKQGLESPWAYLLVRQIRFKCLPDHNVIGGFPRERSKRNRTENETKEEKRISSGRQIASEDGPQVSEASTLAT